MPGAVVPSAEEVHKRNIVGVNPETVSNVTSHEFPHHYIGEDHAWDVEKFKDNLKVQFHKNETYDSCFSLVGVDAAVANAFRRIMIAELPSLAIEEVYMFNNTSIIQDEVLCHRLGLIPLTGAKRGLRWMIPYKKPPPDDDPAAKAAAAKSGEYDNAAHIVPSDQNTIVMRLDIECNWKEGGKALAKQGERDPDKIYENAHVYARHLTFQPQGQQRNYFPEDDEIRPMNPDILVAKLRPGQQIHLQAHCIMGIGADHAKFSPVATASYRLLPYINIKEPILGADAKKFARCFPRGVIELADDAESGQKKAVVKDSMKDTVSRECLRHDEFKDKVQLGRIRDHFIFSIESTGQSDSDELFIESVKALKAKAQRFKRNLDNLQT